MVPENDMIAGIFIPPEEPDGYGRSCKTCGRVCQFMGLDMPICSRYTSSDIKNEYIFREYKDDTN